MYREQCEKILSILQSFAPTGKEQETCSELYRRLDKELSCDQNMLRRLTGILYDGLAYGNWPWIDYSAHSLSPR